ncbi:MFS transporter [Aurantiacibacter odishensis]|uniref:MFS transporter n=1 Tax=Aurantiacibacter odishensis TaxID=1155476 RepID=UPI000E746D34|nr:MFS transporter [Aurantiacibacter odishensis]
MIEKQEAREAGKPQGFILLATAVLPIMAIVSLIPVLPLLLGEFAGVPGSEFLVPMALTIPALCVALFSPVAGWLSDRIGRKQMMIWSLVLYAAFGILPWFLDDLFQIIAARFALGVVEAVIMTLATVLIGDYFAGERRERWIALQIAVGSVAAIVLIAIGGVLGELLGSRGPFLLYLLALPIALIAAIGLFEPARAAAEPALAKQAFPFRVILPLAAITFGVGIIFYTVTVQLGPILEASGPVSPAQIGLFGALCNVAVAIGSFAFHRSSKSAGPKLLSVGLAVASLGYAGVVLAPGLFAKAGFAALVCFGSGLMLPNMLAWAMRSLPAAMRGRGMGLWTGSFFLAQFLAPLVLAAFSGLAGSLSQALMIYAFAAGIGAVLAMFSARSKPRLAT